MKRFFGMMPSSEIEMTKKYEDENGLIITIDAGPRGWTIIYADGSITYKDVDSTTEENFKEAYNFLSNEFNSLKEINTCNSCSIVES